MATIEDLNKSYTKENDLLKKLTAPGGLKDKIDKLQEKLNLYSRDFKVKDAEMQYALSKNDKVAADALKKDLETISKNILDLRNKLEKAQIFLTNQQKKVDEKFADLSKDPEVKQKLDSILYKKYDRKKKKELDKKQQLETIKQIVDSHPTVQSWLKGIEGYEKSIRKCDKILEKYNSNPPSTPDEHKEFQEATDEKYYSGRDLAKRHSDLEQYFAKNHPEIDKDILKNIHSYGNIDKQIAGCDKSIANYDKAMANLSMEHSINNATPEHNPNLPTLPDKKPSWLLHPIKRLKYAINERSLKNQTQPVITPKSEKSDFLDNVKLSKDEYNADIVQRYLDEQYKENLHNVARQKDTDSNVR